MAQVEEITLYATVFEETRQASVFGLGADALIAGARTGPMRQQRTGQHCRVMVGDREDSDGRRQGWANCAHGTGTVCSPSTRHGYGRPPNGLWIVRWMVDIRPRGHRSPHGG